MFPPVDEADEDGLLAIGGAFTPRTLRAAYSQGIFPWPLDDSPPLWFAPPQRAVLFLEEFHIARSVRKLLKSRAWDVRCDTRFADVIEACSQAPRPGQDGTWITPQIVAAYEALHREGAAHSLETFLDGELVGGLYGVSWGAFFAGESMFFHEPGASKVALCALIERLRASGATFLDCQMMTPLFESFGAREVPRAEFMALLQRAWNAPPLF